MGKTQSKRGTMKTMRMESDERKRNKKRSTAEKARIIAMRAERKANNKARKALAAERERSPYVDPYHTDLNPSFEEYTAADRHDMGMGDNTREDNRGGANGRGYSLNPYMSGYDGIYKPGATTIPSAKKWCSHHGRRSVLKLRKCEIFATTSVYASDLNVDLLLACTGTSPGRKEISAPETYAHLCKFVRSPDVISLPWSDGAAPPVRFEFWTHLLKCLPASMGIYCVGSHGRTGTALACLLLCDTQLTALQAIAKVRECHCRESVESYAQREYLLDLENYLTSERGSE